MLDEDFSDSERKAVKRVRDDSSSSGEESSSDDDDESLRAELKHQHQIVRQENYLKKRAEREEEKKAGPRFLALKPGQKFQGFAPTGDGPKKKSALKASLGERIQTEDVDKIKTPASGAREMTFTLKQSERVIRAREEAKEHHEERRQIRRSAGGLKSRGSRGRGGFSRGRGRGRR